MRVSLDSLQERLGYRFADLALLRQALTHRSFGQPNNERLEFLGDSVLNCAVAGLLYRAYAEIDEGDLSRVRANLVRQQSLFEIAGRLELGSVLRLGDGEARSGGHRRPSILADCLEAVFGAVLLDGGFEKAQTVIEALYAPIIGSVDPRTLGKDAKTLLQEHLQGRRLPLPVYSVVATHGAAHKQTFEVECAIPRLAIRVLGGGGSRRAAEQSAAQSALAIVLGQNTPPPSGEVPTVLATSELPEDGPASAPLVVPRPGANAVDSEPAEAVRRTRKPLPNPQPI